MQNLESQLHTLLEDIAPDVHSNEEQAKIIAVASATISKKFTARRFAKADGRVLESQMTDAILIAIRIASYGEAMDINSSCPKCSHFNEFTLNLIQYLDRISNIEYDGTLEVPPLQVHIRPYSYKEVSKTAIKTLEQQKIFSIVNDENMSDEDKVEKFGESFVKLTNLTVDVIAGCITKIVSPEGEVTDPTIIKEFIENSPGDVFNSINNYVTEMKDKMSLKAQDVKCTECENEWSVEVSMDQTNFFAVGS
jgi:hypothetical protein